MPEHLRLNQQSPRQSKAFTFPSNLYAMYSATRRSSLHLRVAEATHVDPTHSTAETSPPTGGGRRRGRGGRRRQRELLPWWRGRRWHDRVDLKEGGVLWGR